MAVRDSSRGHLGNVGGTTTDPVRTAEVSGGALSSKVDSQDTRGGRQMSCEQSPLRASTTNTMDEHVAAMPSRRRRNPLWGRRIQSCADGQVDSGMISH
jgi:hypothetical protein